MPCPVRQPIPQHTLRAGLARTASQPVWRGGHHRRIPAHSEADQAESGRLAGQNLATVNLQTLNEVANACLKKRWFSSPEAAFEIVDGLSEFGDTPVGWTEVHLARQLHKSLGYSWWDCLLLASALELGCSHFLSEDLQDGQVIGGLTIINPFTHAPEEILGPLQD